jgi:hypothetical protein
MNFIDNLLVILTILISSIAVTIYFKYDETYKETILIITSISSFFLFYSLSSLYFSIIISSIFFSSLTG